MTERHLMVAIEGNATESLFECTVADCGQRLVLDHVGARLKVLHAGAAGALHQGSTGLVALTSSLSELPRAS